MAGINFGFDAADNLLKTSSSNNFESGVPRYVENETTEPSFLTEHENMIAASFCPCLIKSAVSIRLIRASGPVPSRIGRNIGKFALLVDGTSTCDRARSTTNNRTTAEIPKTRMGQIRNRNGEGFQPVSRGNFAAAVGRCPRPMSILRTISCRRKK